MSSTLLPIHNSIWRQLDAGVPEERAMRLLGLKPSDWMRLKRETLERLGLIAKPAAPPPEPEPDRLSRGRHRDFPEANAMIAAQMYRDGHSVREIGTEFGVDHTIVWYWLKSLKVPMRSKKDALALREKKGWTRSTRFGRQG